MVGIVGYGAYVPKYRIKAETIAEIWHKDAEEVGRTFAVSEKAVAARDEDAVTLALEAATAALVMADKTASNIEVLLVGSESHPYAVNPTATIVGEFLGVGNHYLAADLEFACKAGTSAVQLIAGLLASDKIKYGLAIGADTAQSRPHDSLEYTAGAGGAALLLGNDKNEIVAELKNMTSYASDAPDFWRRDGMKYPSHGGRFTGEPAYFTHVLGATKRLLEISKKKPQDFTYCVFHTPNGKFPYIAAKRAGFTKEQLLPSLLVHQIGNPYTASSLLGLIAVLESAKPGETIFMVSYGSGAGSDGFIFEVTENIKKRTPLGFLQKMTEKTYIDYPEYLKRMKII